MSIRGVFFASGRLRACELLNLSSSGVLLRATVHHLDNPFVSLRFEVPGVPIPVIVQGYVVRKRRCGCESEWAIQLDRSTIGRTQLLDEYLASLLAQRGEVEGAREARSLLVESGGSLSRLYQRALAELVGRR